MTPSLSWSMQPKACVISKKQKGLISNVQNNIYILLHTVISPKKVFSFPTFQATHFKLVSHRNVKIKIAIFQNKDIAKILATVSCFV